MRESLSVRLVVDSFDDATFETEFCEKGKVKSRSRTPVAFDCFKVSRFGVYEFRVTRFQVWFRVEFRLTSEL